VRVMAGAHRLDVKTEDARLILYAAGVDLSSIDITEPRAPIEVGRTEGIDLHAPIISGDKLYLASGSSGFIVMDDLSQSPQAPVVHGTWVDPSGFAYSHHAGIFEVDGTTYALHNDEVGTNSWYKVLDVTPGSPSFLQVQSEYNTTTEQISHNITMDGTTAYLAYYDHGVRILDVGDPTAPVELGYFHTFDPQTATFSFDGAVDIALDPERNLLFVADVPNGLVILRRD